MLTQSLSLTPLSFSSLSHYLSKTPFPPPSLSTLSAKALCARLAGKRSTGLIGFGSNLSPRLSLSDHTDNCRCPLFPHCCPQDRNIFVWAGSSCSSFLPFTLKKSCVEQPCNKAVVTRGFMKVLEMFFAF